MAALVPARPKVYHIVHVDRLASIIATGVLVSDVVTTGGNFPGTTIGMKGIKERRRNLGLHSQPGLRVGECVPFYFCPRSVMLYVIARRNHENLDYRGGESPILHLEADLYDSVAWADARGYRWAFTTGNAGSHYFQDYADLSELHRIDWDAIATHSWSAVRDEKQAE